MPYKAKETVKIYHSIREVAALFNVSASLLRFWEKEFPALIQPHKGNRGNRLYTEENISTIRILHNLIKIQGYTLEGAKKHFRESRKENNETEQISKKLDKIKEGLLDLKARVSV
jgi:DNA-binding transcriptional MerR regulator